MFVFFYCYLKKRIEIKHTIVCPKKRIMPRNELCAKRCQTKLFPFPVQIKDFRNGGTKEETF